jgi:2-polyprenyl-3-methyl-5-hydroxy-6-metoxy-1,4-benzoquinol methylase
VSWKNDVRRRFSEPDSARRWSDLYRGEPRNAEEHFFRQRCEFAVAYVLERSDRAAAILDLGCGSGPVTAALRRHGRRVIALDYSLDMLRLAKGRLEEEDVRTGDLVQGDSERLPFASRSVEAVVCLGVISYVEDYRTVLREVRRVLKPDGLLVLSTRNVWNPRLSDPVEPLKAVVRRLRQPLNGHRGRVIGRFLSPWEVQRRLRGEGLAVEAFTGIGFGPLRFNRRPLLGPSASIRLSDSLGRAFDRLGAAAPYRWLADVNLWMCRPESVQAAARTT